MTSEVMALLTSATAFAHMLFPCATSPPPHRLPDRGDGRNAVPARRAGPHRRCLRLRRPPAQVRREKPRVSAFISADIPKILALEPELVLAFSDLQAGIVADLVRAGVDVHVFNQRDIAGILGMIRTLGALVGAAERAEALARRSRDGASQRSRQHLALGAAKGLFRGMGRSVDLRHRLGVRVDRDRRRRGCVQESAHQQAAKDRIVSRGGGARGSARCDPRLLVRQEGRA